MIKRRLIASVLVAAMSVSMLAGCSVKEGDTTATGGGNATTAAGGETGGAVSTNPKEIVVDIQQEPPELNPILNTSTGGGNVLRHIVEGLVTLDQSDEPVPGAAESWDISDDKLTYTFHIREDAKWTNGDPVTAHDFVFSWNTLFTPATGAQYSSTWAPMIVGAEDVLNSTDDASLAAALENVGYKAIDDKTLEVKLTNPYPYFLSVLAFYSFAPLNEKAYTEIGHDNYGKEYDAMLTNGPFKMVSWTHEDEIILEKDPGYYGSADIKLDRIVMKMLKDSNARMNSFKAGELDMFILTGDQLAQLSQEGAKISSYDDGSIWYFEFQTTQKGLNNPKVRRALTLAVDAQSFIDNVVKNNSVPAVAYTPASVNSGKFAEKVGTVINRSTDYSEAKALLEEGLSEEGMTIADLKLDLIADDTDSAAKYCAFFQEQWKTNLGVDVTISQMPYKARLDRMHNKDFSIVHAGWGPDYNDPMTYLDIWLTGGGNNHTAWSNAEYDKLISDAVTEADFDKRTEILIQAEKILLDEMPVGPLWNRKQDYVCSERLNGVSRTAFSDLNLRWADVTE